MSDKRLAFGWQERRMLNAASGILLDWDGCIAVNNQVHPAARDLIARHVERVAIVSNNSTHQPHDFERILVREGLRVPPARIFLAGVEAVRLVADLDARVLLLGSPSMRDYARTLGIMLVQEEPDVVLLMRDAGFTYAKLEAAANAVRVGARLIVANADLTHPGPGDRVVPETGALLAALAACTGGRVRHQVIGKPGPLLFKRACAFLGIAPEEAVMIGDNPDTDGKGAEDAGIPAILIGKRSRLQLEHLIDPGPAIKTA